MPFLASVGSASLALVLALAVTIGLILWQTQRQWSRATTRLRWPEELDELTQGRLVTAEELSRWEVRMHELARDLQGQLDTKIALVAELLAQAEQTCQRLEGLLSRTAPVISPHSSCQHSEEVPPPTESAKTSSPRCSSAPQDNARQALGGINRVGIDGFCSLSRKVSAGMAKNSYPSDQVKLQPEGLTPEAQLPSWPAPDISDSGPDQNKPMAVATWAPEESVRQTPEARLGHQASAARDTMNPPPREHLSRPFDGCPPPTEDPDPPHAQKKFAEICRLSDAGLSPEEIARETGLLQGEVELILRLRRAGLGPPTEHPAKSRPEPCGRFTF
jgi:hypothetical protein